ncbi:MAG: transketolase family protein [Clostridia bacterium]|nr:transketolase family protein [Clostridia bacterium]
MADKIATREAYGAALAEFGAKYENLVVLDADLAGATKTGVFAKAFPERFFDCGIAEGDMVTVAAGLSTTGLIPFASSFAMFLAGRAFEQIRNSVGYPHLNVKLGATHGGITVGEDGATHQCLEDFALMRTIPGMTVICPCDAVETRAAVEAAILHDGPVYLRFGRAATPVLFNKENYEFKLGKGIEIADGDDAAIIACGVMVDVALSARELLKSEGINARVIDMHTIKPIDEELVLKCAKETGAIVTAEEHNVIGGLGEAVCGVLSEKLPTPVLRVGTEDTFGRSGKVAPLMEMYGLTPQNIAEKVKAAIALKK